jgi:hypothetical protein
MASTIGPLRFDLGLDVVIPCSYISSENKLGAGMASHEILGGMCE